MGGTENGQKVPFGVSELRPRRSCRFLPKERTSTYIRQKPPNHPILIEDESPKATEIDELPIRAKIP